MATRSSTRTGGACGEVTRKRNACRPRRRRAPRRAPDGETAIHRCRSTNRTVRSRFRRGRRSSSTCRRIGTSSGTTRPRRASRHRQPQLGGQNLGGRTRSPRNASRIRSTTRPTDGKSMAISSAKQSWTRRRAHGAPVSGQRVDGDNGFAAHDDTLTIGAGPRLSRRDTDDSFRRLTCGTAMQSCMRDRECPLCGGTMRLKESDDGRADPGQSPAEHDRTREWVCPDCDYFEEAEEEGAVGNGARVSARQSSAALLCAAYPRTPRS